MPRTTMTPYGEKGTPHMKGTKWLCPLAELKHPLLRSSHLHRIYETLPCPQTDRFISLSLSPPPVFHHDLNLWSWKQKKKKKRKGKCEEVRCDNKGGERKRESWKDSKVKKKKKQLSASIYIYIILPVCFLFLYFLLWWREKRREEKRRGEGFPKMELGCVFCGWKW